MNAKFKQASCKSQITRNRQQRHRGFLYFTYTILAFSICWGIYSFSKQINIFPVKHIIVSGQYSHLDKTNIKNAIQPLLGVSLLSLPKYKIKNEIKNLPWVKTVTINRHWPGSLDIKIVQKTAVAKWKDEGLISEEQIIFFPPKNTYPPNLPIIDAPNDLIPTLLAQLKLMNKILALDNLQIRKIIVKQRDDLSIILKNGLEVLLGRDDNLVRLQRFVDVYPKVFENRLNQVQYVDMRYTNGMAVKWRSQLEK